MTGSTVIGALAGSSLREYPASTIGCNIASSRFNVPSSTPRYFNGITNGRCCWGIIRVVILPPREFTEVRMLRAGTLLGLVNATAVWPVARPAIEVITDMWGRPKVRLTGAIAEHLADLVIHVSLTHEGDTAAAVAILEAP